MSKRIQWVDFARGIAILAVIVGHTLGPYTGRFWGSFIFAFHMPIFFVLSGYLYHQRSLKTEFQHGVVNLLIPYLMTIIVVLLVNWLALRLPPNPMIKAYFPSTKQGVLGAVYGAGSEVFNPFGWKIPPIGAIWFLTSMFIAVQLFNGILVLTKKLAHQQVIQALIIVMLATIGGCLGRIVYLPWAFNAALLALVFLYAGYVIRQTGLLKKIHDIWYVVFGFAWLISALQGYFALTVPVSPNLVISVFGGIGGSLCVIRICIGLSRFAGSKGMKWLARYGRLSLIVLCFHLIDLNVIGIEGWLFSHSAPIVGNWLATIIGILYRVGFATFWMVMIPKIPVIRVGFFPRKYFFKRSSSSHHR